MPDSLIALVGLGNPGPDYARTRHNAGFWFVDLAALRYGASFRSESKFFGETARLRIGRTDVLMLKPMTFMNRSGQSVAAFANFYKLKPAQLLVAHDELDLSAGTMRLKLGGGHGGHNGLRDIHKSQGEGYRRLRVGIGHPGDKSMVLNYVLGRPNKADEEAIFDGLNDSLDAVETWLESGLDSGWDKAVQQLHTAPPK
jgi:PTH1 family peptidyl-tRNA hydrolase